MKTIQHISFAVGFWGVCALVNSAHGSIVVVSNLEAAGVSSALLMDASETPLESGCLVRLVSFGDLTEAEIQELWNDGVEALMSAAVPFGSATSVATGAADDGRIEFQLQQPLEEALYGLHIVVFNGPSVGASDELMVLSLPDGVPADSVSGLDGYVAVHLDSAEVVVGGRSASGFTTTGYPGGSVGAFATWIASALGPEADPEDLLLTADADGDGLSNLIEYAIGSDPGSGVSSGGCEVGEDRMFRYLRRTDDPALFYQAEVSSDPEGVIWEDLTSEVVPLAPAPSTPPASCEWVGQELPVGNRVFARLRIEAGSAAP